MGTVPAMQDCSLTLIESLAIDLYIPRNTAPRRVFYPIRPRRRGEVLAVDAVRRHRDRAQARDLRRHTFMKPEGERDKKARVRRVDGDGQAFGCARQAPRQAERNVLLGDAVHRADVQRRGVLTGSYASKVDFGRGRTSRPGSTAPSGGRRGRRSGDARGGLTPARAFTAAGARPPR
jgi:glutathione S-transferase